LNNFVRYFDAMREIRIKWLRLRVYYFSILLFFAGYFGCERGFAQEEKKLSIEIMAPRDSSGHAYLPHGEDFDVRFSNTSDQPVIVWDDLYELGHWTLSFNVKGLHGESQTVQKRKVSESMWTNYPPKTVVIPPGKTYSLKVDLSGFFWGEREWLNVPEPNTGEQTEVSAVFEVKPTEESQKQGVWTGRIESAALVLPVLNPKLKTPQDYLWNACPQQALKMLKDDPSWIHKGDAEYQCTPLHHAARFGYKEVVVWLIKHGADVNAVAYNGFTPLHLTERKEIAEILIKAGANLDQKDSWGKTPLQHAAETQNQEVVDAIIASGYKLDLYTAILLKRRDVALKMLIHNPDVIVGGDGGSDLGGNVTPLGLAAAQGDLELVKLLTEAGAPINDPTECIRYGGNATPLCNAVWAGRVEIVEFLLKKGAATDVVGGKFYHSIAEYAEHNSDKRIVELLAQYKKNPSIQSGQELPKIKNKLPGRIASGDFKLPNEIKEH
jgi:ankyrin repeat protein